MRKSKNKRGFTLIEIVLVLVLIGILSAVAMAKYYDLKTEAEDSSAYAYVNQFSSDVNARIAELLIEGKTCKKAYVEAVSELNAEYIARSASSGMVIGLGVFFNINKPKNYTKLPVVFDDKVVWAPANLVVCEGIDIVDPQGME